MSELSATASEPVTNSTPGQSSLAKWTVFVGRGPGQFINSYVEGTFLADVNAAAIPLGEYGDYDADILSVDGLENAFGRFMLENPAENTAIFMWIHGNRSTKNGEHTVRVDWPSGKYNVSMASILHRFARANRQAAICREDGKEWEDVDTGNARTIAGLCDPKHQDAIDELVMTDPIDEAEQTLSSADMARTDKASKLALLSDSCWSGCLPVQATRKGDYHHGVLTMTGGRDPREYAEVSMSDERSLYQGIGRGLRTLRCGSSEKPVTSDTAYECLLPRTQFTQFLFTEAGDPQPILFEDGELTQLRDK